MDPIALREEIQRIIELTYSRSGGAGGQNVNKVNTRVTARLALIRFEGLTDAELDRVRARLSNRINADDELVLHVQDSRSQWHNRILAIERAFSLVEHALRRDPPRRPTAPTRASKERRLAAKARTARIKRERRGPFPE